MLRTACAIFALASVFTSPRSALGEIITMHDIPKTQEGVVKIKEYYDGRNLLVIKEWLKLVENLSQNGAPDTLVVQNRHRYFYNFEEQLVLEIGETPDGTISTITVCEYDSKGQLVSSHWTKPSGREYSIRLYEDGHLVTVESGNRP